MLFCFAIDVSSNSIKQPYCEALTNIENIHSNGLISNIDFIDDDQMYPSNELFFSEGYSYHMPMPQNCIILPNSAYSLWQPPKI